MKNKVLFSLTGFISVLCMNGPVNAESGWMEMGMRGGISANSTVNFEQYEMFAAYRLSPQWTYDSGWLVQTQINATLGKLRSDDVSSEVISIGPGLTLSKPDSAFSVDVGSSPTYISDPVHGGKDLGGNTQFISHIRLNYRFSHTFAVGFRFQHMSNAGLENPNPGLNIEALELSYRF